MRTVIAVLSVLCVSSTAQTEDWHTQTSSSFESTPRTGAARLSLVSMAVTEEQLGASMLGGFVRLPYGTGLQAELPVVFGESFNAGSPALSLAASGVHSFGNLRLQLENRLGVRTPSLGLDDSVAGEEQLATQDWRLQNRLLVRLGHRSGLSLSSWVTNGPEMDRYGAGLDYRFLSAGQVSIGIGVASSFSDSQSPSKALAHVAYRPSWLPDASVSLFASTPLEEIESPLPGADSAVAGLSIAWDFYAWRKTPSNANQKVTLGAGQQDLLALRTKNAPIALAQFVVPGKVNVFAFEASWCGPCYEIHRELLAIASQLPELHIRTINADDKVRLFKANGSGRGLPLVVVFGRDGREFGRLNSYKPNAIGVLISKANKN